MTTEIESPIRSRVMKVTSNGQISLPAEVRRRWQTSRVIVIDTPGGLVIRPFDAQAVRRLRGKHRATRADSPAVEHADGAGAGAGATR